MNLKTVDVHQLDIITHLSKSAINQLVKRHVSDVWINTGTSYTIEKKKIQTNKQTIFRMLSVVHKFNLL